MSAFDPSEKPGQSPVAQLPNPLHVRFPFVTISQGYFDEEMGL
jgi:hypothetical protein